MFALKLVIVFFSCNYLFNSALTGKENDQGNWRYQYGIAEYFDILQPRSFIPFMHYNL